MELLEFLQNRLGERATLAQAVDAFAEMCDIPVDSEMDMLLFESGNFGFFVSDASFQVSLVRQFTTGEEEGDEFTQLHMDLFYEPTEELQALETNCFWSTDVKDFWQAVRDSAVFRFLRDAVPAERSLDMDET